MIVWLLACTLGASDPEPVTPPPTEVEFIDHDAGTRRADPVVDVPDGIRWYTGDGKRIAVARVEIRTRGEQQETQRFDVDGRLLDTMLSH